MPGGHTQAVSLSGLKGSTLNFCREGGVLGVVFGYRVIVLPEAGQAVQLLNRHMVRTLVLHDLDGIFQLQNLDFSGCRTNARLPGTCCLCSESLPDLSHSARASAAFSRQGQALPSAHVLLRVLA